MCGFVGFSGALEDKQKIINLMADKIIHRGPDSSGFYLDEEMALGFRRLSIIDLQDGTQPMYNENKSIVIVFNGEIYNHKELRYMLIEKGHEFSNKTDTEVLIHAYEEFGATMLDYLRGMFAFAIYDINKKELFCARDFYGIKPFYYCNINNNLIFGSEIKSFLEHPEFNKEVNLLALENYLTFQYSVLEETFFKGVYKLPPGHYLTFKNNEIKITKYYEANFNIKEQTLDEAVNAIDETIKKSVEAHKESDVEVGSFLSSGVDSNYIASIFNGHKTFTVGFDHDNYSEIDFAKNLCEEKNMNNISKIITTEDYWSALSKVQYHMDEPLADPSAVALYFVSNIASEHVKVVLSGEGADEFFGGYNIYKEPIDLKKISGLPKSFKKFLATLVSCIPFKVKGKNYIIRASKSVEERFIGNANLFSKKEREAILKNPIKKYEPQEITKKVYDRISSYDDITKMQYIDINFWLVGDILLKADKISMAHSLELRVPILDKYVFNVASSLPTNLRVTKNSTKYAFRESAKKYMPESTSKKKKLGFPVPIRIWLKEDKYFNIVKEAFVSQTADKYFNTDKLLKLLNTHKKSKIDNSRKIWAIYMFLIWHKEYFE